MESNATAFLIKIKLRHSLGRPSRSDFVQSKFVWKPNKSENRNRKVNIKENIDGVIG